MSTGTMQSKTIADRLEGSINRDTVGAISISSKNGLAIESMSQVMEFSKLMALATEAIPKHLRNNVGACLAISIQAYEWQISPFALANKSYVVNDRLCYEASLYHAVVARRAPIKGRLKQELKGEGDSRTCRVWATLDDGSGEEVSYTSPPFGKIQPKNSPLWKNDPDQQLHYFSVRAFARRHFPDVMMGIYTVDEMQDTLVAAAADLRPKADRLAERIVAPLSTKDYKPDPIVPLNDSAPDAPLSAKQQLLAAIPEAKTESELDDIMDHLRDRIEDGELTPIDYEQVNAEVSKKRAALKAV